MQTIEIKKQGLQVIGFLPKENATQEHRRVVNLTGDVQRIEDNKVDVLFHTKEGKIFVKYNENETKLINPKKSKRINNLTFWEFCKELEGYDVYKNNRKINKFELFWNGIKAHELLTQQNGYSLTNRPVPKAEGCK